LKHINDEKVLCLLKFSFPDKKTEKYVLQLLGEIKFKNISRGKYN
jgi:hypothetical protein